MRFTSLGGGGDKNSANRFFEFALSDETTAVTASTSVPKFTWRAPFAFTITSLRALATTAPTGSDMEIDVHTAEASGTIFSTTPVHIDDGAKTSVGSGSAYDLNTGSGWETVPDENEMTFYIDKVGSTVAGAGIKLRIYYDED